jgi:hypothetical protein
MRVVFGNRPDDGIAQGERSLGKPQNQTAGQKIRPRHAAEGEFGQPEPEGDFGKFRKKRRLLPEGDKDSIKKKEKHGRNSLLAKEQEREHRPSQGKPGVRPHHPQPLNDEGHTEAEHDPPDHRLGGDLFNPGNGARGPHKEPEQSGKNARGPDHARGDGPGVGDGHPADGFHGLDGDGRSKIEAGKDLEKAESHQDPKRIHFVEGDIAHDKRNQGSKVPKGPGKFIAVVFVPPQAHKIALNN